MEEEIREEIKINTKEEAVDSLEKLHIQVYNRSKGKGLSIIENIVKDDDELLKESKELYIKYITSISNDISNTIKRAFEFLG